LDKEEWCGKTGVLQSPSPEANFSDTAAELRTSMSSTELMTIWKPEQLSDQFTEFENEPTLSMGACLHPDAWPSSLDSSGSLADFVERRFIPEYVARKTLAGRAHFQAILKHILTPRLVNRAFGAKTDKGKVRLREIPGWQYLDSMRLDEVTPETIQHLVSTVMRNGYSTQTATHIRNVVCAIFSHALTVGMFSGTNPATGVVLPAMSRKKAHALTLPQLKQVMGLMAYPEREIALFLMLTDMNVAEICGLRWKNLNISPYPRFCEGSRIPPRTVIVANQSYRGESRPVLEKRKRTIPVPELLCSTLLKLTYRGKFTTEDDLVLASRTGNPISPDNLTARRLKSIGNFLEMPWLSWNVFHRTQIAVSTSFGRQWLKELENVLPRNTAPIRPW
jgi:site-specific recombinase XerD